MKKKLYIVIGFLLFFFGISQVFADLGGFGDRDVIWNQSGAKALNATWITEQNSIREGMYHTIHNPKGGSSTIDGVIDH